jgi:hypothetical protein
MGLGYKLPGCVIGPVSPGRSCPRPIPAAAAYETAAVWASGARHARLEAGRLVKTAPEGVAVKISVVVQCATRALRKLVPVLLCQSAKKQLPHAPRDKVQLANCTGPAQTSTARLVTGLGSD